MTIKASKKGSLGYIQIAKRARKNTISMTNEELQEHINRVKEIAMGNVGTFTSQVEALKKRMPSDSPTLMAGPRVRTHRFQ